MNNQNFDGFFNSDSPVSSSNTSTATSHIPGYGTTYNPSTLAPATYPPQQQQNPWTGCYRPLPPNQDYQFQPPPPYYGQPQPPPPYYGQTQAPPPYYGHPQAPPPYYGQPQPTPPSSSQPGEASASKKKSKKSKKDDAAQPPKRVGWSEDEALQLSRNWIAVSEDPRITTNQDKDTFWYRVLNLHNQTHGHNHRSKDSLTGKWTQIAGKVKKFNGIYSQLISGGGRASGTSDEDLVSATAKEYEGTYFEDFTHFSSWQFLKDKQKFLNPDPCVVGRRNRRRDDGFSRELPVDLDANDEVPYDFHSNEDVNPRPPPRPRKVPRTSSSSATGSGNTSSSSGFFQGINDQVANFNIKMTEELDSKLALNNELRRSQRKKQRKYDMDMLRTPTESFPEADRDMIEIEKAAIRERFASGYYNDI